MTTTKTISSRIFADMVSPAIINEIENSNPFAGYDFTGKTISDMPLTTELISRFAAKVDTSAGPDACWPWLNAVSKGYGQIRFNGQAVYAHRVAATLAHGTIPDDMMILHACDDAVCVNPAHLRIGTAQENSQEMSERGRSRNRTLAKLQVFEIKQLAHSGEFSNAEIADRFAVNETTVQRIMSGLTHKKVVCPSCERGTCPQVVRAQGHKLKKRTTVTVTEEYA